MSEYKYFLKKIYQPDTDLVILEVADKRGQPVFAFRPGQYAMISYKNSLGKTEDKHAFSFASSPTQNNYLRFGIRLQGAFTRGLLQLKEGDEIIVAGPYGKFIYDENKYANLVLIAGGIGVTPFVSALNYATDLNLNNKLSLIYSTRTIKGATFYEELKDLEKKNPNISTLYSFTDEAGLISEKNVISKRIDADIIKNFIGNTFGKTFFICGPTPFMNAMITNLLSLGVERNQIELEEFSMIPDKALWSRLKNFSYALGLAAVLFTLSYNLINKNPINYDSTNNTSGDKKVYDVALIDKLNRAAYDRLLIVYNAKNKALADLNQQVLAATKANSTTTQSPTAITAPVVNTPIAPIISAPAPISAPTPAPTPRTRVS